MMIRAHIIISGRVQGVFYRAYTKQHADRLGVKGWVKNLPEGEVEAVFEGEESAVKELVDYSKHGPTRAVVTRIDVAYEPFKGEFKGFSTE
jgi:acylphosphatase